MRTKHTLAMIALMLIPASAHAQEQRTGEPAAQARIDAALSAATRAGIPASLLESKVAEGRAKGVPDGRIAAAVEARLNALVRADEVLRREQVGEVSAGELGIVADALDARVDAGAIVDIMKGAPRERRAVATAVLTQLVQLGQPSDAALLRVNTAVAAGADALANLQAEVAAALRIRGDALFTPGAALGVDALVGIGAGAARRN